MRKALLFALSSICTAPSALEVQTLEVSRDEGVFHVVVDVLIDAAPARVRAKLLDVEALPELDASVKAVRATPLADGLRVESELEECLFGICRRLLHVQKVQSAGDEISAETLPVAGGSFKSGIAHWQLKAEGQGTRLLFTADTEPDLWLPPLIGPPVVLKHLREKTLHSLQALERLARE